MMSMKNLSQTQVLKMMFGSTKKMDIPALDLEIQYRDDIKSKPGNYLVIFVKLPDDEILEEDTEAEKE